MNDLLLKIREFNQDQELGQFHLPKNLAMAMMTKTAKLAEHYKWLTPEESLSLPPEKLAQIKEEIGDILICLITMADKLDINPVTAAHEKLEINRQ
jgi:NTP pyrophosphatase (non-canonical NTP hydrolase)